MTRPQDFPADLQARHPLFARLLSFSTEGLAEARREGIFTHYRAEPPAFFDEVERELRVILDVEGRSLEECLVDLEVFNSLSEETENDAWYARRAAFVSMHLDFLLLGFSRRRLEKLVEQVALPASRFPAASICDIGSGCGRLAALLLERHPDWQATLVDRSEAAAAYAGRYMQLRGMASRAEAVTGDLLTVPAPDASFDVVIAAEVLEHTTDAQRAASELVRCLRVGGTLCISIPVDLAIGMHPVVFQTERDIAALFEQFPLRTRASEMVRPVPGLDAICDVFPGFQGCLHATFERVG
jgi:2-polyprenyl-3-methyl-5-hydroxy-6-metoxy-1,4-benzoquinol methylase